MPPTASATADTRYKRSEDALARAHVGLGILLGQSQDLFDARREFATVLQIDPRNLDALNNLAVTYLDENPSNALKILSQVLRIQPDNAIALHNRDFALQKLLEQGNTELKNGQIDQAETDLRQVTQIDPSSAIAHNNLGLILIQRHRIQDSADEFAKAVRLQPDMIDARKNLAGAQLLLKRQSSSSPSSPQQ
jgi:Flp pilus assembly protein TadD